MHSSLSITELSDYTSKQLNFFYPDKEVVCSSVLVPYVDLALQKIENCFRRVNLKHYFDGTSVCFNHLYTDHYVMYLWYLSNIVYSNNSNKTLCDKIYYLNKSLHAFDCMYDTKLPDIFLLFHCSGTMLGKATYSNYFVALQGCTVGMNKGFYPIMDKGVALTAHSSLIGNCNIGKCVSISSYTNLIDKNIESNQVVFKDENGNIKIKPSKKSYAQSFFNEPII